MNPSDSAMTFDPLTFDDHFAASAVASLGSKREREETGDDIFESTAKKISLQHERDALALVPPEVKRILPQEELKPFPFFFYRDFSAEQDPDPLTPLTPPGRVPNFPSKMHAILSRQDLADIISWMPHGRSWRVLKPREFEVRVIPTYFEHAKFSSFIRQANGWGFRRITQGRDRNSYYHPLFLRGLPHLCKKMKRPGVSEKQAADPDHEPDLAKISELHPVPEKASDDSILLQCTLQGGPKARMPIYSGAIAKPQSATIANMATVSAGQRLTPADQQAISAFQHALGASENQFTTFGGMMPAVPSPAAPVVLPAATMCAPTPFTMPITPGVNNKMSPLALANQLAFAPPNMAAALQASNAASQFAAGFAAAAAISHQQFQSMLSTLAANMGNANGVGSKPEALGNSKHAAQPSLGSS